MERIWMYNYRILLQNNHGIHQVLPVTILIDAIVDNLDCSWIYRRILVIAIHIEQEAITIIIRDEIFAIAIFINAIVNNFDRTGVDCLILVIAIHIG